MKYALTLLLLLVLASATSAGDMIYALTYEPGMTAGETKDFIDKISPFGGGIELRGFKNPFPPGLSFSLSWHAAVFSEDVSYVSPAGHLLTAAEGDGTQKRDLLVSPFLIHTDYHFTLLRDEPSWIPYLGLGVGPYWLKVETELGGVKTECSTWHFGLAPEAGFMVPVSPVMLLMVAVRYNYAFEAEEPGQEYWTLALGVGYNP